MPKLTPKQRTRHDAVLRKRLIAQLEDLKTKIKKNTPTLGGIAQESELLEQIEKNTFKSLIYWGEE